MDEQKINNAFQRTPHLNILADLYLGKNLTLHLEKVQSEIETVQFIIDQEGYLQPGIDGILDMKLYFKRLESHISRAVIDPNHRPSPEDTINTDCDD